MRVEKLQIDAVLVDLAGVDYLDLWAVARVLDREFGAALDDDPEEVALEAIERLVRDGTLRAGDLVPPGEFEPWDRDAEESIRVIRQRAARREGAVGVGEVGWFSLAEHALA